MTRAFTRIVALGTLAAPLDPEFTNDPTFARLARGMSREALDGAEAN